jgi:hypothetical protein
MKLEFERVIQFVRRGKIDLLVSQDGNRSIIIAKISIELFYSDCTAGWTAQKSLWEFFFAEL